jgi:hypothetical protein
MRILGLFFVAALVFQAAAERIVNHTQEMPLRGSTQLDRTNCVRLILKVSLELSRERNRSFARRDRGFISLAESSPLPLHHPWKRLRHQWASFARHSAIPAFHTDSDPLEQESRKTRRGLPSFPKRCRVRLLYVDRDWEKIQQTSALPRLGNRPGYLSKRQPPDHGISIVTTSGASS